LTKEIKPQKTVKTIIHSIRQNKISDGEDKEKELENLDDDIMCIMPFTDKSRRVRKSGFF